jgi:predicted DNA-binding protein (MmcQ/YjbR family)
MTVEWVRRYCMGMPQAAESVQWGDNLVFKVGGKMFAIASLEPGEIWLSFPCTPESFAELVERPGIRPAPYLARAHWVALETADALPASELKRLLRRSYEMVVEKLPKKSRDKLGKQRPK